MIVSNIQPIQPGTFYNMKVRLQTVDSYYTADIYPTVDVLVNHNYTIVDSIVETMIDQMVGQVQTPDMAKP